MNTTSEPFSPPRVAPRLMLSAPPPAPPARTWFRLSSWLAGIALLTASLVGASHVLNARPSTPDPSKVPAERSFAGPAGVVCLGTVDHEAAPGGFIPLSPVQAGEVTDLLVYESQPVKKGDVLLKIDDEAQVQTVAVAEVGVRLAEALFAQAQQLAERHKAGVEAQQAAIDAGKHKIAAADFRFHRFKYLKETMKQSNDDEVNAAAEDLSAARAALVAEEAKLREVQSSRPDAKIREAEENVALARQRLEQARLAVRKCVLEAPADGTVLRINVAKGAVFGPQSRQAAMLFAPAGPRVVRAEVEQEFAHRLQAGMTAMIQDESGGQTTWRGRVKRLGAAYLPKRSNGGPEAFALGGSEGRVLECLIELDAGQPQPLIGQKVRVNIGTHAGP